MVKSLKHCLIHGKSLEFIDITIFHHQYYVPIHYHVYTDCSA